MTRRKAQDCSFRPFNLQIKDLRGQRFGILHVPIDATPESRPNIPSRPKLGARACWPCVCECGGSVIVDGRALRNGSAVSCGASRCQRKALNLLERSVPKKLLLLVPPVGKVFGCLTVVGQEARQDDKGRTFWTFRCQCGRQKESHATKVVNGLTKSCGCLVAGAVSAANIRYVDRLQPHRNFLLANYKRKAVKRGIAFEISARDFEELSSRACWYCGRVNANDASRRYGAFRHNGIDRVDSSLGYTKDNCVACCRICNVMKLRMSVDEFIAHVRLIVSRQQ